MHLYQHRLQYVLSALVLLLALLACSLLPTPSPEAATPTEPQAGAPEMATATPTPTPTPGLPPAATTPAPPPSRCEGLAGQLEVQVLVGPAEVVGLEPVAVGSVPFAASGAAPPYGVQGQGPISYEDTLQQEWGSYTVTMDLDVSVQGECSGEAGGEQLDLVLEMTGEQLVVVDAEGFHGEYPWAGTQTRELAFPLEEGATAQGEGWAVVLHLGGR